MFLTFYYFATFSPWAQKRAYLEFRPAEDYLENLWDQGKTRP